MQHTVQIKSKNYAKMQKAEQKEDSAADKALKVEQKINDIAQTVEQVGKITETVGKVMVYAGNAMSAYPPTAAAGRALAVAGGYAEKAGKVAQTVGQYGQTAAQAAMSLTYAAKGDLGAALQSAGSAIQSGASAVQSTKAMKSDFAQIDKQVADIGQKAEVTKAAADQAKNMAAEDLEKLGMSKKEFQNAAKAQFTEQAQQGTVASEFKIDTDKAKEFVAEQRAQNATKNTTGGKGIGNVWNKAKSAAQNTGNWLEKNGEEVGQKLTAMGNKYASRTQGQTAGTQVGRTQAGRTQGARPDFSAERAELARRSQKYTGSRLYG